MSTPTYEITQVDAKVRDWTTQKGAAWKSYRVTLRNQDGRELGNVEVSRSAANPAPSVGERVEGTVDKSGSYGPKLTEPRKFGAGGGGGPRVRPPEERRSIAMQSSLQRGVDVVRVAVDAKAWEPASLEQIISAALAAGARFFDQVMQAEKGTT